MPRTTMAAGDQATCEVKVDGAWRSATLTEARGVYRLAQKRCPACHGQVIVAGTYTGTGHLKLQHRRAHAGCPLSAKGYTGTPSLHPQALV
jgi:hypothetical protein